MARKYTHVKVHEEEIMKLHAEGRTRREIGERYGLTREQVKELVKRYNRRKKKEEAGILPSQRGRPLKRYVLPEQEKDNEIRRLKMENELLRDFLRLAEVGETVRQISSHIPPL